MSANWPELAYSGYDRLACLRSLVRRARFPLHRGESYRPFFIVGPGRCGTTLLRRILAASPEIHIPPESYMVGRAVDLFRRYRTMMHWDEIVRMVLALFEFHRQFDRYRVSLRPLVLRLVDAPPGSRSLALILDGFYRYHGEQTGQEFVRWGDKTPLYSYSQEKILAVFPDARFVHLVRDGADVALSMLKAQIRPNMDVERAAVRYKITVAALLRFARRHPAVCHRVRYEDLVADAAGTVEALCRFLDVAFDPAMIESTQHRRQMADLETFDHHRNVFKPITTASIGGGRRELSAEQKARLQELIGPELRLLGYDPVA
jgi:protein-tyrosine sulfotransferase